MHYTVIETPHSINIRSPIYDHSAFFVNNLFNKYYDIFKNDLQLNC